MKNNQPREGLKISENSKISQERTFQTFLNKKDMFRKDGKMFSIFIATFPFYLTIWNPT